MDPEQQHGEQEGSSVLLQVTSLKVKLIIIFSSLAFAAILETANVMSDYSCIHCMGLLSSNGPLELRCNRCGRIFPVISDIPVLTVRPRELLMVHLQELRHALAAFEETRAASVSIRSSAVQGVAERIRRMLHGMGQNLDLIEKLSK